MSNCPSITCIGWTLAWQLPCPKKRASSASGGLLLVKLPEHHLHQVDSLGSCPARRSEPQGSEPRAAKTNLKALRLLSAHQVLAETWFWTGQVLAVALHLLDHADYAVIRSEAYMHSDCNAFDNACDDWVRLLH